MRLYTTFDWLRFNFHIFKSFAEGLAIGEHSCDLNTKLRRLFIWPYRLLTMSYFDSWGLRLNLHITGLGILSVLWSGHLVEVGIRVSRSNALSTTLDLDSPGHIFRSNIGAGSAVLTFLGGLKSDTVSLYLSDIAHHHLGVGVLFLWGAHLYFSIYKSGFAHRIRDMFSTTGLQILGPGKSLHLNLGLALTSLSVITSVVASISSSLTPFLYISLDYVTRTGLYIHHSWITSFLSMGAASHIGIYLLRDYLAFINSQAQDPIGRMLAGKHGIISHLSYICLWLGFHTLGIYIHNDGVTAFGQEDKELDIEPVFAQIIQEISGKPLYAKYFRNKIWVPRFTSFEQVNKSFGSSFMPLGPGDMVLHHAIALGLHVTFLILLKGALNGRGSKLLPDKIHQTYHFPCDGPGRYGTCDISAWDSVYLAKFWSLNTTAWILFYFHWKHLRLWENTLFQFDDSSTYLNAWFRDYLWFNSTPLILAHKSLGTNDLGVWAWIFLAAHLCWATGFMFLISWRGYWEELIHIILVMHLKTPYVYDIWDANTYTPVGLSILQARFVGLSHFAIGFILTYAAFIIGATS